MKITATRGRIVVSALGVCGILALTGGAVILGFFEKIVRFFLKKELVLKPGNEFFDIWQQLPIPVYQKIYLFNITNPEEFLNGTQPPILEEKGPYTFKGKWMKSDIEWNDEDGTLTYKDVKDYTFVPELSSGSQDEMIYTLNAPLLGVINHVEEFTPFFLRSFVVDIMNNIFASYNQTLLVHKTVEELIYMGYFEPMIADLTQVVEPFVTLPLTLINNTFGILHEKKHRGDGTFTIKSGKDGIEHYTNIESWNNKTKLPWLSDSCSDINATDGVQFAPGIKRNETLRLFNPHLCRTIPLTFEKDMTVHGIKTLRYTMPRNVFSAENPDNKCYCTGYKCISGIMPLNCKKGAPYVLSLPHFLDADESLKESVMGINSTEEKHKSYIDVEPRTGFVLNGRFRIQLNAVTKFLDDYNVLKNAKDYIIPVMWMSEEAQVDAYFANYFKTRVSTPIIIFWVICLATVIVGAFWTISSGVFLFCIEAKVKPEALKHSVVLKTLNSVYTTVALWPPEDEKDPIESEKTHL